MGLASKGESTTMNTLFASAVMTFMGVALMSLIVLTSILFMLLVKAYRADRRKEENYKKTIAAISFEAANLVGAKQTATPVPAVLLKMAFMAGFDAAKSNPDLDASKVEIKFGGEVVSAH
jgi:hypothetical protein